MTVIHTYTSVTPTIDTNAYTSGDALGGLMTISDALITGGPMSGELRSVMITDLAKQSADVDVVLFHANPSSTTVTNNAALDIHDSDIAKIVAVVPVRSHYTFNDNSISVANELANPIYSSAGGNLYAVAVVRGTPTYATASDLVFRFEILQDGQ